jgi:RHS repeat-associated protein
VDAGTGAITARYEYGPFGEPIRATGTMAKKHPLRFSTKYTDNESGFLYYGYRYYNPSTGRWLNRDPFAEYGFQKALMSERAGDITRYAKRFPHGYSKDGQNNYGFCSNDCIDRVDYLGLCGWGRRWHELHPPPKPLHSPKAAGQQCCKMRKTIPKGHSDFTGAEQFRFELYDKWNRPFPCWGDPGPHFQAPDEIAIRDAIKRCDIYRFSALMHQLQDSICHKGYKWDPCRCKFGHLWASIFGPDPDRDPERWKEAEEATIPLVDKYRAQCPHDVVDESTTPPF